MNSNTSNPDEAKEATDKSTKKNIPGLALLLLDLAVALVGFLHRNACFLERSE
ncbi:hypothetical protein [Bifidobacterium longum]|uniref:hypothetical protein n=1 Tax=Bifidobacterium longum TaxID=216816 RepID=UPI0010D94451|nr:hypothetical protein [Bifidobacterium longum]TCF24594.1 hypothetical protein MCC10093_1925 [Bifidobacterium longum subsp. longum]